MKRKICVITGTRAEYGLLRPVMDAIQAHPQLELMLMVTGMHLSPEFGNTKNIIDKEDGFAITWQVKMNPEKDDADSMAVAVGKGIIGMTHALSKNKPDITLVLGDRIEALAGTIASIYLNIPVAHIHGGDISKAGLDESARHAITKMANIHFAVSPKSKQRILKMGEAPKSVFMVGAPALDTILRQPLLTKRELSQKYNFDLNEPYILLVQHPVTTQVSEAGKQIEETLSAVRELKMMTIIICPNSDAGGRKIIQAIDQFAKLSFIKVFKSLPHKDYLSFLKYASVMVGNSSSGIIESSSFKLPVINVGIRQEGRERSQNVIDVPHNRKSIVKAIYKALHDRKFRQKVAMCKNPYSNGRASDKIVKILGAIKLGPDFLQKQITY